MNPVEFDITTDTGIQQAEQHFQKPLKGEVLSFLTNQDIEEMSKDSPFSSSLLKTFAAAARAGLSLYGWIKELPEDWVDEALELQKIIAMKILELSDRKGYKEVTIRVNPGGGITANTEKIGDFPVKVTETNRGKLRIYADLD